MQKDMSLPSQLSTLETFLNNVYEISCPSPKDYVNRRHLVHIFNEMAKEMYGDNEGCPIVKDFGSFVMDIFNAGSDLDLSINFSDKLFEDDRLSKIKTLRKFAKIFYNLRKKGHVTKVELILSARVPVLKVTDKGSGIECDFSVGNRDGIAKSHIVLMVSSIDERFKKLCFLIKAWANANDINSSKDGTLNSISLILLAACHLQTRDIPILPPFSSLFEEGMDPLAINHIPSFLNYGERNKESLAELFVSFLVKLDSVQDEWKKGLCASTYEGSWIYKDLKATGCIRVEDFSDRSQNTARAVKSANFSKIYSCIRHSLEHIQAFKEGKLDAEKLKNLLFVPRGKKGRKLKLSKLASLNATQKNANSSAQVGPEGQLPKQSEIVSPNASPEKKKRSGQVGPEGQKPGKQVKLNPCTSEAPEVQPNTSISVAVAVAPTVNSVKKIKRKTKKKKSKSGIGKKTDPHTSDTVTSSQVLSTPLQTVSRNPVPLSNPPIRALGGVAPSGTMNNAKPAIHVAQSNSNQPSQSLGGFGHQRASVEQYGGYRPQRSHADASSFGPPNFPGGQHLAFSNQHSQSSLQHLNQPHVRGYGRFGSERTHVDSLIDATPNFRAGAHYSLFNSSSYQMSDSFTSGPTQVMHSYQPRPHVVSHRNPAELNAHSLPISDPYTRRPSVMPHNTNLHTASYRNPVALNSSSLPISHPYNPRPASVMPHYQSNLHTYRNSNELDTRSLPMSDPYHLASRPSSVMHPYQPHPHSSYHRNPAKSQRPFDPRQSFPPVHSQFPTNMHPRHS